MCSINNESCKKKKIIIILTRSISPESISGEKLNCESHNILLTVHTERHEKIDFPIISVQLIRASPFG